MCKITVVLASVFLSRLAFDAGAEVVAIVFAGFGGYLAGYWDGAKRTYENALCGDER